MTMSGGRPRAPVPFGSYEVGRSKKPVNQKPTAAFKDGMQKAVPLEPQGDPGAYDPYMNADLVASASFTHNKTAKPFMQTSSRELAMQLYGEDSPGPGAYMAADAAKKQYPAVDPNISVFRSGSLQRYCVYVSVRTRPFRRHMTNPGCGSIFKLNANASSF